MYVFIGEPKFSSIGYKVGARFRLSKKYIYIRSLVMRTFENPVYSCNDVVVVEKINQVIYFFRYYYIITGAYIPTITLHPLVTNVASGFQRLSIKET